MKTYLSIGIAAAALLAASAASAQFLGQAEPSRQEGPRVPQPYLAPKPATPTPYTAPNRVHWKLTDIKAAHRGQTDWTHPVVRNLEQEGDYISLGAGKKTKTKMYADDRIVFIVWEGSIRVSIDGVAPFVATKGFMVSVPFRRFYSLENVGTTPALRFEVRAANLKPIYPVGETPDPLQGHRFVQVTGTPGISKLPEGGTDDPIYVDFMKQVASGDQPYSGKFVWDDNFTSNILRGRAAPVPADTNLGHFHVDWTEFWFIMEGRIGYKIEGFPYFVADAGDVVTAAEGRWHRAGNDPSAPMSTRIPFNPRPPILHNFEPTAATAQPAAPAAAPAR